MLKWSGKTPHRTFGMIWILFLAVILVFNARISAAGSVTSVPAAPDELKQGCLQATIRGVNLEIARYQSWIAQRKQGTVQADDLSDLEADLARLQTDLRKFQAMPPADYLLPKATPTQCWFNDAKPGVNSILYFDGLSRSGPWYHLAGISGDNFGALTANQKYQALIYQVYPRNYGFMKSAYVYLVLATQP